MNLTRADVEQIIKEYLNPPIQNPPEGYNTLEVIRGGLLHWVPVPFNDVSVWCQLRCHNGSQLDACGKVTLVNAVEKIKDKKSDNFDDYIKIRNTQEKISRLVLNNPTYEQLETMILGEDHVLSKVKKEFEELKNMDLSALSEDERREVKHELREKELFISFILPENTLGFLTAWGLGTDVSDIAKASEDMLLDAACLATRNHNSPTDNLAGRYTDRDRGDLDASAWKIYDAFVAREKRNKDLKHGRS